MIRRASAVPTWPSSWIVIDWDRAEDGTGDDWRDVEYAFYQFDVDYLYLKLQCYSLPGGEWLTSDARYKWFIDTDGTMYYGGGNIYDAECLLFVEDTDHDGSGEMYLVKDSNGDNSFDEYEPWPPADCASYEVTDPNTGGWSVVAPNQIEMYVKWASIATPPSYGLFWTTDQANPNLDQGPTTDRVDEEQAIIVHNVASISQIPTPQVVNYCYGEHVLIEVVVANTGTQVETFSVTCYFNNTSIETQLVSSLAAGHQATLFFDWDTSGLPIGNYTITAWADSSAAIAEIDELDNWCTSPATVTIQPVPVHDVAAVSQVPDQVSVVQGTVVNINVTVSNLGDFTETFNVTCFYGDTPIGYETVTDLPSQVTTSKLFVWDTTGVTPNTYYVRAMADSSRSITEANENNNNCTSFEVVSIHSSSDMGKLFVDKVKTAVIAGGDPPVVGLPTVYELTIIVTNIGGSALSNVNVSETISSESAFVSVGTPSQGSVAALPPPKIEWNVGALAPGAYATLVFWTSTTPSSSGVVFLNHKEDILASGTDTLSNTTVSDTGDTDITVTAIIRDVAAVGQVPSSTVVNQGETAAVFVTLENLGNVSETFDVTCHYDSTLIGVIRVYNLAPATQTAVTFELDTTGIPPGTYSITASADSSYEIIESNEVNNLCTSESTVEIVIHDIAVLSQDPSPTSVASGEIVTIYVLVRNEGTETETFDVSCYYNEIFLATKTVASLVPNATLTLTFTWNTTGVPTGTYFINTHAIPVPDEANTDNNACQSVTSVTVTLQRYYLTVSSPYGTPGNEGWYDSGDTAYAALDIGEVDYGNGTRRKFTHWSGDASGTSHAQSDPILMDGPKTAIANWKTQYYLTVTTNPSGIVTIPGQDWYDASANVPLTAPAVAGHNFQYWNVEGASQGSGVQSIFVLMSKPKTATSYYLPVTVGGASVVIDSPSLATWVSTNSLLVAIILAVRFWAKRQQRKGN
jgi:uncharacterized repeat protein (TIGR01451 family)